MNDRQENKLNMFETVHETMTTNQSIWQGVPAIVAAVTALGAVIATIQTLAQTQKQPTKGATKSKANLRTAMADAAEIVTGALKALASATGNAELAGQAHFTRTDFTSSRDSDAANDADIVRTLGTANLAALADYGIVQADLTALATATSAFRNSITRPRQVVTVTSGATAQLDPTFDRGDVILNDQLDGLMLRFRLTNPALFL